MLTILAQGGVLERVMDHPWPGCQVQLFGMTVTWMSNGIATMLLVAMVLLLLIIPTARRYQVVPTGWRNVLEVLVMFVRDRIALPALGKNAEPYLPFLLTVFMFILGMEVIGLMPLEALFRVGHGVLPLPAGVEVGATPLTTMAVGGGMAAVTLTVVIGTGWVQAARNVHHHKGWPIWLCAPLAPLLWVATISPPIPGIVGLLLKVPLTVIEIVGTIARCISLMIRIFANMVSGHCLLAVFIMLFAQSGVAWLRDSVPHTLYVGPLCLLAGVGISMLEVLVAGIQSFVFTFLSAIFISLSFGEAHGEHG